MTCRKYVISLWGLFRLPTDMAWGIKNTILAKWKYEKTLKKTYINMGSDQIPFGPRISTFHPLQRNLLEDLTFPSGISPPCQRKRPRTNRRPWPKTADAGSSSGSPAPQMTVCVAAHQLWSLGDDNLQLLNGCPAFPKFQKQKSTGKLSSPEGVGL